MTKQVVIARDVFAPDTWERATVDDVCAYIKGQFETFPETARIYHNFVAIEHDVTPYDDFTIDRLQSLYGVFYVVVYPADPITLAIVAASVAISVATVLLIPQPAIPDANGTGRQATSPNNELSNRGNRARPNARIPDIYGTVRSVPDLISVPYSVYENNVEVEHCVMCIGRGQYQIHDAKDDKTDIAEIEKASVWAFPPDTDMRIEMDASFGVGDFITDEPLIVRKSNSVNGQTLRLINDQHWHNPDEDEIYFTADGRVVFDDNVYPLVGISENPFLAFVDWSKGFEGVTQLEVKGASFEHMGTAYSLDGVYDITALARYQITLDDPVSVNSNWSLLYSLAGDRTPLMSCELSSTEQYEVGDFVVYNGEPTTTLMFNFLAPNGIYYHNGDRRIDIANMPIRLTLQPCDADGEVWGVQETQDVFLSSNAERTVGMTYTFESVYNNTTPSEYWKVSAKNVFLRDYRFDGQSYLEVKWKDLYSVSKYDYYEGYSFPDVTVVRSRTVATTGALSVKERKLNLLVTRMLPTYDPMAGEMSEMLSPTNKAADAFVAACVDPLIGRRSVAEVDLEGIYQIHDEIVAYFGTDKCAEFSYTFDKENLSFEEIATTIAQAIFCEAYRQGNKIKLSFEKETDDSVLLFNHRNKVPKSERRTITFGIENNFDGVELEWTDPKDEARVVLKVPSTTLLNPKKLETVGVRNRVQAHMAAWRVWNKLRYQRETVEFDALRESDLLVRKDRVLVADNTRLGTQDGEIVEQLGLILTTSQQCIFESGKTYTMHLQLYDGSVDAIACTAGADAYHVVLARVPLLPLVLDADRYLHTTYMLVADDDARAKAFLVGEKSMSGRMTNKIKAVNYDSRYYQNDGDYLAELIT